MCPDANDSSPTTLCEWLRHCVACVVPSLHSAHLFPLLYCLAGVISKVANGGGQHIRGHIVHGTYRRGTKNHRIKRYRDGTGTVHTVNLRY
jgi:hypothetical protein